MHKYFYFILNKLMSISAREIAKNFKSSDTK